MTAYRIAELDDTSIEELLSQLPSWRREKAMRFKFESGRRECAASYLLLVDMLREAFGMDDALAFCEGEHGKPTLVDARTGKPLMHGGRQIHFNISHCKRAVACAVSNDGDVGIDIEQTGRYKKELADYCMSIEEVARIVAAADCDEAFTRLWTQKEALLKLTGEGITDDVKSVLTSDRMDAVTIETYYEKAKGYCCSIAKTR